MSVLNKKNRVSVVVPVYNGENYIERCFKSIQGQDGHDICEIIFINDGSTDNTATILENISETHPNFVKVYSQENKGQASARNIGLQKAKGELVAFIDVDDIWYQEKIKKQISLLDANHSLGLVFGNADIIPEGKSGIKKEFFNTAKPFKGSIIKRLLIQNFIPTSSVLVKKQLVDEAGGFPEEKSYKYIEDYFLWIKIASKTRVDYCDETVLQYTDRPGSSSSSKVKTVIHVLHMLSNIEQPNKNKIIPYLRYGMVLVYFIFEAAFSSAIKNFRKLRA